LGEADRRRHPEWLKVRLGHEGAMEVRRLLRRARLHTVCQLSLIHISEPTRPY